MRKFNSAASLVLVLTFILTIILTIILTFGSASSVDAKPLNIRMPYVTVVGQLTPLIYALGDEGLLKNYGKSYTVTATRVKGTSPMITGLAAGEFEVAYLAFSSFANTVVNAGLPIKILSDGFQTGSKAGFKFTWYTLPDSDVKTVKDLRGKTIAINTAGAGVDLMLRAMLKKNNLVPGKDVNIAEVSFPHMEAMLREKKIDAGVMVVAFYFRSLKNGPLRPLFKGYEAVGDTQFVFPVALESFIAKNYEVLVDFNEDYLIGLQWFRNPANRDKALDLASKFTKVPRRAYAPWAFKPEHDYYRDPTGEPDLITLQKNIDLLADMKFIKRSFDVKKYTDLRALREAQARFKKGK